MYAQKPMQLTAHVTHKSVSTIHSFRSKWRVHPLHGAKHNYHRNSRAADACIIAILYIHLLHIINTSITHHYRSRWIFSITTHTLVPSTHECMLSDTQPHSQHHWVCGVCAVCVMLLFDCTRFVVKLMYCTCVKYVWFWGRRALVHWLVYEFCILKTHKFESGRNKWGIGTE